MIILPTPVGAEPLWGYYVNKNQNNTIGYCLCVSMGDTSIFYRSANEDVNKLSLNVLFFQILCLTVVTTLRHGISTPIVTAYLILFVYRP